MNFRTGVPVGGLGILVSPHSASPQGRGSEGLGDYVGLPPIVFTPGRGRAVSKEDGRFSGRIGSPGSSPDHTRFP